MPPRKVLTVCVGISAHDRRLLLPGEAPLEFLASGAAELSQLFGFAWILLAVAKARVWIDELASGRIQTFAEIARSEGKVERHIRLLTPLAFFSPRSVAAIIDRTFRQDVTVTTLARAVPFSWELPSLV
jgi:hypothetical protein